MKVKITQKYRFFRTVPKPNWNIVKIKKNGHIYYSTKSWKIPIGLTKSRKSKDTHYNCQMKKDQINQ
jgi:uncharacterized protein YcnI